MLDDLGRGVDQTDSKLSSAVRRMRNFVRETEGQGLLPPVSRSGVEHQTESKSGWCIAILIAVLLILLLAVILV